MKTTFVSEFAERLVEFISQKRAFGYTYCNESDPKMFDRMCAECFPGESSLTKEICNAWATRRGSETAKSTAGWSAFIREFSRYLLRNGEQAYVLPKGANNKFQRYIPHIYSRTELAGLWRAFDDIKPTTAHPVAHLTLPMLVRILYCCGMRPGEALKLGVDDVDLRSGKIFIAESKGNRDRIIMLADDVLEMCCTYNEKMQRFFPIRKFFFAQNADDTYDYGWINYVFRKIRDGLCIESRSENLPRLYDLRHTFATHRLYQWMRDGKDLYAMMPYLSSYMGHSKLTETFYYVHLVPGMLEKMSGFSYGSVAELFPEAVDVDE
jgi:integrase